MRAVLGLALVLLLLAVTGTALAHPAVARPLKNPNPPSCTDHGDRFTKLTLLNQLPQAPHILVLGSSRARPAMPKTLQTLTGGSAFNAGVHQGNVSDEYVFARLLAQRFPAAKPGYLIFVDVGIANDGVNPEMADEPLAKPFLGSSASSKTSTCVNNNNYTADGGLNYPEPSKAQRAAKVAATLPGALAGLKADGKKTYHIIPSRTTYLQKLLALANNQGATPVIVLNPLYPKVLAARKKYGFPELKAANTYLTWLHTQYQFISLNGEDIKTWGGKASDFSNVNHIDRYNMDRLLAYVVAHSNGALLAH
jgi:hypothetical protein